MKITHNGHEYEIPGDVTDVRLTATEVYGAGGRVTHTKYTLCVTALAKLREEGVPPSDLPQFVVEDGKLKEVPAEYRVVTERETPDVKSDKPPKETAKTKAEIRLGRTAFFVAVGEEQPYFVGDLPTQPDGSPLPLSQYHYANPGGGSLQTVVNKALLHLEDRGVVTEGNATIVFSPSQAREFAVSPEFREYMRWGIVAGAVFALDMTNTPNDNPISYGLPRTLYGVKVLVR